MTIYRIIEMYGGRFLFKIQTLLALHRKLKRQGSHFPHLLFTPMKLQVQLSIRFELTN